MWYAICTLFGGACALAGGVLSIARDNWAAGNTWRGQTRHEGRQS